MHVASVSKLVTAMAMTRLLDTKGISYDTPIAGYLPKYWAKGPNVGKITFRHLMTQRSGLDFNVSSSASDYSFMKAKVAAGTTHLGQYWYQSMNFGLCRILISTINGNISPAASFSMPGIPNWNDLVWDAVTISAYAQYVHDHVFAPAGVSGPTLTHPSGDALAYSFPANGAGWNSGDLSTVSGGAGWHMSVDDLLDVMGAFRRQGTIMSKPQAQTMLDAGFGIDVIQGTPLGTLYNKNGAWGMGGKEEQSLAYFLPQDMELVVLANSPVGSPEKFFRGIVTDLYLANIKHS
jgi:CubicO group peptidase (beta-lactamase class C family)